MTKTPSSPDEAPGGHDPLQRNAGRLAAVQALYQVEATQDSHEKIIKDFLTGRVGGIGVLQETDDAPESTVRLVELDTQLFINIVRGVQERGDEIDGMIKGSIAAEWPWERLEMTLRALLRAGVAELLTRTDIPGGVTVVEFVDVAHAFYAGPEPRMVNAVLDRIARALGRIEGARRQAHNE